MNNISICLIGGIWKYKHVSKDESFDLVIEDILCHCQKRDILNVAFHNSGIIWKLEQILTLNQYDILILLPSEIEQCVALNDAITNFIKKQKYNQLTILTNNEGYSLLKEHIQSNMRLHSIESAIEPVDVKDELLSEIKQLLMDKFYAQIQ